MQILTNKNATQGYPELAKKNVAVCPTLIGGKQDAYLDKNDHQRMNTIRQTIHGGWTGSRNQGRDNFEFLTKQLPFIQSSGMVILAGTDAAAKNDFIYPGWALHQEL